MQRKSVVPFFITFVFLTCFFLTNYSVAAVLPGDIAQSSVQHTVPLQIDGTTATTVLSPTDDAPVRQGAPNSTAVTEAYLGAGYDNGALYGSVGYVRSYLRFDLSSISADSTIISATVRLTYAGGQDYPGVSRTVNFYRVTGDWSENSLTWNNRPGYATGVLGSVSTVYNYSGQVSFGLTDQVRNWVSGSQSNYGLIAIGPESIQGVYRTFFSKGYVGEPELHVQYIPAPPPVLDAWPGSFSAQANATQSSSASALYIGNVTYDSLDWTAVKLGGAPWLNLSQSSGNVTPTTPDTVNFTVDASGLSPGTYTEQIQISSGTPNVVGSPTTATFTLEVLDSFTNVYLPIVIGGSGDGSVDPQKIVAVVVGIADYEHLDPAPSSGIWPDVWGYDLYAPIYDVADFINWLRTRLKVPTENIVECTESCATAVGIHNALGQGAQKVNEILNMAAAEEAAQAVDENAIFIFYYSGHGAQNVDDNGDESDGYDEFIAAYDTNLNELTGVFSPVISDDDLEAELAAVQAGTIVVIIDSCYSGSLMSTTSVIGENDALRRGLTNPAISGVTAVDDALSELAGPGRVVITGGTGDQLTWESYSLQNGIFTHYFLQGLDDALHDANGNGRISAEEAYWFSRDLVDNWVYSNTGTNQNPNIDDQQLGQVDLIWLP